MSREALTGLPRLQSPRLTSFPQGLRGRTKAPRAFPTPGQWPPPSPGELTGAQAFLSNPPKSLQGPLTPPLHPPLSPIPSGLTRRLPRHPQVRSGSLHTAFMAPGTSLQRTCLPACWQQGTQHEAHRRHWRNTCWTNKSEFMIPPNFTEKQTFKNQVIYMKWYSLETAQTSGESECLQSKFPRCDPHGL